MEAASANPLSTVGTSIDTEAAAETARATRVYGLSPMQAGMLYQALLGGDARAAGFDIQQIHVTFDEALDPTTLGRAFTLVTRRHDVLSTAFSWDGEPQQQVHNGVVVPFFTEDWGALSPEARAGRRVSYLTEDRRRGFDLRVAPLQRVALFTEGPRAAEMVWTFHHILLDGRSFAPVLLEVFGAYEALREGRLPPAPTSIHRPYADYIAWLATRDPSASRAHFRDLLRGRIAPTPLPGAEPAQLPLPLPAEGPRYGEATLEVSPATVAAALALAKRSDVGLAIVVQAALALVLSRFTGEDDVVFGSTRSCRRSALGGGARDMIGMFINTVPVRAQVGDDLTVGELLRALAAQNVAVRGHENLPLVDVQGQSEIPRGTPLFETLLMFERGELAQSLREQGGPRWARRTTTLHEQPSPPLSFTVNDVGALRIRALFDRRRFRPTVVDRLLAALAEAIGALAAGETRRLAELDIIPAAERARILIEWNETARPFPDDLCIHQPFEARVQAQPSAVAVEMDGRTLTFAELEARANQVAHALRARGAGPGRYIGVCFDRGLDLIVALLAVAKSGAAYLPLDPQYPKARLAFMLKDAAAAVVLTERKHSELFGDHTLVIDDPSLAAEPKSRPSPLARASDAAYAIFTSGSTGQPKGVVLSHRAVLNTFDWVNRTLAVGPGDRLLLVTSPCFDLSVYDVFGALGAGATVVVASEARLRDPAALAAALTEQRITIWDSAPAALQRLVTYFGVGDRPAPLRLVMLSGDWIPLTLPDAVRTAFPMARVISLGGATEAAIWSNWFPVETIDPRWASIPYGRPIQNARYHVLDRRLQPTPVGVPGDLYIGGACLAEGYLARPELTDERFIPDPFQPGQRLYRTGDLARYFDDGSLEFLGRADFQVKIRGFRVELGEVEAALLALPGVREAICTTVLDASGQRALVAYLVPTAGTVIDEGRVRADLGRALPDYMVPSHVVPLPALPLSPNGKIDRQALPSPTARHATTAFVAPRTETERRLATLWEELLGRNPIGVTDNFFALGGHSLLAVILVSRLKERLGWTVPLSRVLEQPTIAGLAATLSASADRAPKHLIALNAGGRRVPLVLVAGVGGFAFTYKDFPKLLGPEQPVLALQAIGAEVGTPLADHSIEEMAEIYEPEVTAACPRGDIVLGGFSFGALPAFALAQRLRQRGRRVPLIISFDGFAPGYPERLAWPARLIAHARELVTSDRAAQKAYLRDRAKKVRERLFRILGREAELAPSMPWADREVNERLRQLWVVHMRALARYRPTHREPGDMLLVRLEKPPQWLATKMDDPLYGWQPYFAGKVSVVTVPGQHTTLFAPENQDLITRALSERLEALSRPR